MNINKKILAMGAGAGVGVIVPTILKKYVEPSMGQQVPYLDSLKVWGTWHVFVPLVSGAAAIVLTQFTRLIRNDMINDTLAMYGFAALFSGVIMGATETYVPSAGMGRARMMGARPQAYIAPRAYNGGSSQTPISISRQTIVS